MKIGTIREDDETVEIQLKIQILYIQRNPKQKELRVPWSMPKIPLNIFG